MDAGVSGGLTATAPVSAGSVVKPIITLVSGSDNDIGLVTNYVGTVIGGETPAAATFTTLQTNGATTLGNASSDVTTVTAQLTASQGGTFSAGIFGTTISGSSTLDMAGAITGNSGLTINAGTTAVQALTTTTIVASGIVKTDDTTEATTTTDGSLQTDGGLSVAKSAVIGDDLDLLSDGAIMNIGSTSKFTLTDQAANNCVMAASGARLAFGNAGEYISGDGTDLDIISSGDLDITATLVDVTGAGTFSGILKTDSTTDATTTTDGSLQTDGGLSVAKAIYNGTAATLAADSGVVTIGSTTAATFSAAGLLNVNNATEATSTTDGSLQTDGGLSVAKSAVVGDDLDLLSDAAILNFGADKDVNLTHVADTGILLNSTMAIQFNDSLRYIKAGSAADLDLVAETEINMDCTTVDINAALDVSGATTLNGAVTLGDATGDDITFTGRAASSIVPKTDSTYDLGSATLRFANVYTGDLHLRNERGDWTLYEESDHIKVRNNRTGKMFRMALVADE